IYLGQRAYGFAAACDTYFGKHIKDVTLAEAAMLAGLPKAPSAYNPVRNPRRATIRQQYIIDRMLANGFITQEEHDQARAEKLAYRKRAPISIHAEYVAEAARQLIQAQYGTDTYTRGLVVTTSIDMKQQTAAYHALRDGLMTFDRRQPWRGPVAYIDLPSDAQQLDVRVAEALEDYPDSDDIRTAVVLELTQKGLLVSLQSGEELTISGDGLRMVRSAMSDKANPKL